MPLKVRHYFLGKPLAMTELIHERLSNVKGLAIFASDALSSTAYATEEILWVLVGVGTGALGVSLPIAFAIAILIFIVAVSYQQVIYEYPQGGGVYNVARENLNETSALLGASSLLIDYVLTAAVSVAAGVAAITSAFPFWLGHRVLIGALILLFLMWANLRGVRETGKMFALPTYIFIISFFVMIGYGVWLFLTGNLPQAQTLLPQGEAVSVLGLLLILHAFASGCTAMTGIEATSNGVQAFYEPVSHNAARTLLRMASILIVMFLGITFLAYQMHAVPRVDETVVSQIARLLFGSGAFYFVIQIATALILLFAANTPFAAFPRVAFQLARDGYFPRQFMNLGTRLVFANGIVALAGFSILLLVAFGASTHALIPLYAVGVFFGFSISQFGMVRHWMRKTTRHTRNIIINMVGCIITSLVFVIVFVTKFSYGAWILVPTTIVLVVMMKKIKSHYLWNERVLALDAKALPTMYTEKTMVLFVPSTNRASVRSAQFIKSFMPAHFYALHVALDAAEGEAVRQSWEAHVPDVPIDIVVSENRSIIDTTLDYLKGVDSKWKDDSIIVVLSELIPPRFIQRFLHNQTAARIRLAIEQDPALNVEILQIPIKIASSP